jgi:hypothetical protein
MAMPQPDSAQVRAQVAESRRRQGLPEHIQDPRFLADLAAMVLDREEVTADVGKVA